MKTPLNQPIPKNNLPKLLVVDDDPASLIFFEGILRRQNYDVITATNVDEACARLEEGGLANFSCVVTDCWMPVRSGIDLLHWVHEHDASLATIITTAATERQIAADSLRGGASDFLEKPVNSQTLKDAVKRAIALTEERRQATASREAVKTVGEYQQQQLISSSSGGDVWPLEVCFHPKCEAGGDFLSHFRVGEKAHAYLLTDVSGHDLKAAFLSAYFQGMVRGMMERKASMTEIFQHFNRCLLEEWNEKNSGDGIKMCASIAACSLLVDRAVNEIEVVNCGSPLPVCIDGAGQPEWLGRGDGYPLGWFEQNPFGYSRRPLPFGGSVIFWTDGLEAYAEEQGVTPIAMASMMLLAKQGLRPALDFKHVSDDILAARVQFPRAGEKKGDGFYPIVLEDYPGNSAEKIDTIQATWEKTIRYCVPAISESSSYAIMLSIREAMLNAFTHGCGGSEHCSAKLRISYHPGSELVRVVVQDPGTGHEFDLEAHKVATSTELISAHRGLLLMEQLSDRLSFERRGARIVMDFSLNRLWT